MSLERSFSTALGLPLLTSDCVWVTRSRGVCHPRLCPGEAVSLCSCPTAGGGATFYPFQGLLPGPTSPLTEGSRLVRPLGRSPSLCSALPPGCAPSFSSPLSPPLAPWPLPLLHTTSLSITPTSLCPSRFAGSPQGEAGAVESCH